MLFFRLGWSVLQACTAIVTCNLEWQNNIGVERRVSLNPAGFPVQPKLLLSQSVNQQAAQLRGGQAVKALQQVFGLGHVLWQVLSLLF